jgi:type VI secretion system VasD/TssJ family lipoprotein
LQAHRCIGYGVQQSLPQSEAIAHTEVRRHFFRLAVTAITLGWPAGCHRVSSVAPAPARTAVQVLIQAGPAINPGDDGQPWPTALALYQLHGAPDVPGHGSLDPATILTQGAAAFGDRLLDRREYTAFPGTRARLVVSLGPEATHLVAVAHFREPPGDAAVLVYPVPHTRAVDPCFYLALERSELDGGEFPPPGFDPAAFATTCPSPADLATRPPVPDTSPTDLSVVPTAPTSAAR